MVDDRQGKLLLIKHAMPEIDTSVPSRLWRLSAQGQIACQRLSAVIAVYSPDILVTSDEPKAVETGEILARSLEIPCNTESGLRENDRTDFGYLDPADYEKCFRRFFSSPEAPIVGRETAHQAYERFHSTVVKILDTCPTSTVAIVAHGTVISLFLQHVTGIDPFLIWQRLGLPSVVVLSRPTLTVERIIEQLPGVPLHAT